MIYIFLSILLQLTLPVNAQQNQNAMWNYNTGRNLETQNRMTEANAYYNEAIRLSTAEINLNNANRDSYVALTYSLRRQLRYAEVISWGERGLRTYSDEHRLVEIMGEAYFYLNDHDTSLRFMQRYVNEVPQGGRASVAYFFMGEIYRFRRSFQHADIAYTTAINLYPNNALWWYRLASVREAGGNFNEAISAYERAINLDPAYREAIDGLARSRRNIDS